MQDIMKKGYEFYASIVGKFPAVATVASFVAGAAAMYEVMR